MRAVAQPHLVHTAEVLVVLPSADLNPVHQDELPGKETTHVDVLEGLWQVLWEASLVPEDVWLDNLLNQDASNAKHSPAGVDEL